MSVRLTVRLRTLVTGSMGAFASFAMALHSPAMAADKRPEHPNIVLVILDDVGLDTASNMYPGLIDGLVRQYGPAGLNDPDYRKIEGKPASKIGRAHV